MSLCLLPVKFDLQINNRWTITPREHLFQSVWVEPAVMQIEFIVARYSITEMASWRNRVCCLTVPIEIWFIVWPKSCGVLSFLQARTGTRGLFPEGSSLWNVLVRICILYVRRFACVSILHRNVWHFWSHTRTHILHNTTHTASHTVYRTHYIYTRIHT